MESQIIQQIREMKKKLLEKPEEFEIKDDKEWAYWTGQASYYLISKSKSKELRYDLLEPFINKTSVKLVKQTIYQLIEKYKHELIINNKMMNKLFSKILDTDVNSSFTNLKIYFYIGVFDDNVLLSKKQYKGDKK